MADPAIFTPKELAFLRELRRNKVPFMIVGLSAAALQGAPMVTQDVDLWFRDIQHPGLAKALKKLGGVLVPPIGLNPPMLAGKHVECFDIVLTVHGVDSFDSELAGAVKVPIGRLTLDVLPLDRIIASKKFLNRPKDRMALPALRAAANVRKEKTTRAPRAQPANPTPRPAGS